MVLRPKPIFLLTIREQRTLYPRHPASIKRPSNEVNYLQRNRGNVNKKKIREGTYYLFSDKKRVYKQFCNK